MANNFELESNSASWNQQNPQAEHDDASVPLQVAQATSGSQPSGQANQPAAATSEPKPVDVGATPAPAPAQAAATPPSSTGEYIVGADKTVHLPANTSIDNIRVEGTNLVLQQADGSVVVIKDGAINVPTFIVGDVEFPRVALLAALQTSGVDVAFGADGSISAGQGAASNPSAGGNFEHPAGGIGDGFDLSSLLPPTELQFGLLDERELYPAAPNRDPIFADFAALPLSEEGLAGGNPDNDGSNDTTNATLITGRFPATDPDGDALSYTFGTPSGLTSGGVPVTWTGQGTGALVGSVNGVTVITITATGDSYTIEILGPIDHPNDARPGSEDDLTLVVPVTASDGKDGSATANMSIIIEDDSPAFVSVSQTVLRVDEDGLASANADSGRSGENDFGKQTVSHIELSTVINPGADGLGSYHFASGALTQLGGLGLSSNGAAISYSLSPDGHTITGSAAGVSVFTVELTATGSLTFTLLGQVDHVNSPGNVETNLTIDLSGLIEVADKDGDTLTPPTGSVVVSVGDDIPVAALVLREGASVLVDESLGQNAGETESGAAGLGQVTVSGASLFNTTGSLAGSDSAGATTSFSLEVAAGGHTGLFLTGQSGAANEILLVDNGGVIEGRVGGAGGTLAFTVTINAATGNVTLTQFESLNHLTPGASYDEALFLATGALKAVYTVTDGDKDVASASVDLGGQRSVIAFEDDGPTAVLALAGKASIVVDESLSQNGAPETEPAGTLGQVTVLGASLFDTSGSLAGQDEEGATTAFSLEVAAGGHTGLFLTGQSGAANEILLVDNGGVIEGRVGGAGGTLAFTVSIDASTGNVTLTQFESLNHPAPGSSYDEALFLASGALKAVYTVTDGDKDVASATVDLGGQRGVIAFEDDGPTAVLTLAGKASIVVDESLGQNGAPETEPAGTLGQVTVLGASLFDTSGSLAGQDEEGATTAFSLEIAAGGHTGLFLTGQSGAANEILLVDNGGVIEGRVGGAGGTLAFTVSIDASTGNVTLTQFESLNHPAPGSSYDEALFLASGALKAVYTVTDGDLDVATATVDLGGQAGVIAFEDDGPTAMLALAGKASIIVDETVGARVGDANADDETAPGAPVGAIGYAHVLGASLFDTSGSLAGQDEEGATTAFSLEIAAGGHTGLFLTGQSGAANEILLVDNGGVIEGRVGGAGGTLAFTVSIDASTGNVTLTQFESLNHLDPTNADEALFLASGALKAVYTVTDGDKDVASATVDLGGQRGVIAFEDDGPTAVLALAGKASIVVDETVGARVGDANADDETAPGAPVGAIGYAHVLGASLFDTSGSLAGQDEEGATTAFSLEIAAGGHTGLFLTGQSGAANEILLVDNGGVIEGRVGGAGGTLAFTVSIDAATGDVTLTQYESLNHPTPGASYDEALFLATGVLKAVYTVTDGDQDVATATVDLGGTAGVIAFEDDGPTAVVGGAGIQRMVVEDTMAAVDGDASTGIPDAGQNSTSDEASGTLGSLGALFNAGADEPLTFSLNPSTGGLPVLFSHGIQLIYTVVGDTLTAKAGAVTVFTLTVHADGSWNFDLQDQLDHVAGSGDAGTLLRTSGGGSVPSIDFSSMIVGTDGDGDTVTDATPGAFTITVQNDVPVVVALPPQTGTETTSYVLPAGGGHDRYKVLEGANDKDILLSARTGNVQDAVNTSNDIGVGNGQNIDADEYLILDFVKHGVATGNNMSTTFTATEHYSVASVTFTVPQVQQGPASLFLQLFSVPAGSDNNSGTANFTDDTRVVVSAVTVNGNPVPVTVVYAADGFTPIGYLINGVAKNDSIQVTGVSEFGRLVIANYDGMTIHTGGAGTAVVDGATSFSVLISETTATVVQPFGVRHDESPLVNNTADPNIADDTSAPLPSSLTSRIGALALTEIGHAVSAGSVAGFFTSTPGADEPTSITYQLSNGTANNPFTGQDSGLTTTDGGIAIKLFSDPTDPRILWGVAGNDFANDAKVFAAYVDDAGKLWLVQFEAIHNPVAGSTAADYDDAVTALGNIHVTANVTDADGDVASAVSGTPIKLTFQDDGPQAVNDVDSVVGATLTATGNVLTAVDIASGFDTNTTDGSADKLGTDGAKIASVTGQTSDSSPDALHNFQVNGQYGSLVLNEDGSYVYTRFNGNPVVATETFTYVLKDGDGDTATATLTISLVDNGTTITNLTPAAGGGDATVWEANLSDGSSSNPAALIQTGDFTVSAPDGLQSVQIGNTILSVAQLGTASAATPIAISGNPAYGTLEIIGFDSGTGKISYRFTLTDNTLTHTNTTADATPGDRGTADPVFANYQVTVTDVDTDSSSATLAIRVLDDGPTARADADAGIEGALIDGNVLTGIGTTGGAAGADVFGADGPTVAGGGVTGVATGSNTASPVTGNVGSPIVTALGTLTLNADGSYTYQAKPNAVPAGGATDSFVYTITDGDGDTSTVTLTINLSDSGITASDNDAIVNEAGLATGSDAASNSEIFATGQITASSAVPIVSYTVAGGGAGTYGTLVLNPTTGAYTYTLTSRYDTSPDADNATNTEQNRDVFTYTATDANGNTVTGTIEVDIKDDVPTARADADAGIEGALIDGNVLTGIGTTGGAAGADVFGADGPT
ncbi:hypothetical protein CYK37_15670, partial [Mesorhizobium loti]